MTPAHFTDLASALLLRLAILRLGVAGLVLGLAAGLVAFPALPFPWPSTVTAFSSTGLSGAVVEPVVSEGCLVS